MLEKNSDFWFKNILLSLGIFTRTIGIIKLIICLGILGILFYFSKEIIQGENIAFDESFLLKLHQYTNSELNAVMLFITRLGNPETIITLVVVTLAILSSKKYLIEAKIFAVGCLVAEILGVGLKFLFGRSRPELWTRLISETSFSFPSGHALGSLFVYGFIAYLLAQAYPNFSKLIYIFSGILIVTIGFSRLFLGVHWPSDIIAGYGLGFIWLMICLTFLRLQISNFPEQKISNPPSS